MQISAAILIIVIILIIMLGIFIILTRTSRRVNLTSTPDGQKPEWMRSSPPPETLAATKADGEGVTLYDYDAGEKVAAPFAEQIEDILNAQISVDPYLQSYNVDFGTAPDGGLEIIIGDRSYTSIEQIPDERLRAAIKQAVDTYNKRDK